MTKIKMPAGAGTVETSLFIVAPNRHSSIAGDNATYMKTCYGWCLHSTRELRRKLARAAKKAGANHG